MNGAFHKWLAARQGAVEEAFSQALQQGRTEAEQSTTRPTSPSPEAAPQSSAFVDDGVRTAQGKAQNASTSERQQAASESVPPKAAANTDWYEILQISRNADPETIHRVYRIMAARFHPDNPRTGNVERFMLLTHAYRVLSDPERRAQYDAISESLGKSPLEVFELKEFVDGIEGECNRRLGILSLLYQIRRRSEAAPGISVLDLERRMSLPREYLSFTLWYLRIKGYITAEENSDYSITPEGVDYVEKNSAHNRVIRQLLEAPGEQASKVEVSSVQQPASEAA